MARILLLIILRIAGFMMHFSPLFTRPSRFKALCYDTFGPTHIVFFSRALHLVITTELTLSIIMADQQAPSESELPSPPTIMFVEARIDVLSKHMARITAQLVHLTEAN